MTQTITHFKIFVSKFLFHMVYTSIRKLAQPLFTTVHVYMYGEDFKSGNASWIILARYKAFKTGNIQRTFLPTLKILPTDQTSIDIDVRQWDRTKFLKVEIQQMPRGKEKFEIAKIIRKWKVK